MWPRIFSISCLFLLHLSVFAQEKFTTFQDLRTEWMTFEDGSYKPLSALPFTGLNTIYFELDRGRFGGKLLLLESSEPYFLFVNGKVMAEYQGRVVLNIDSISGVIHSPTYRMAIRQDKINERDLRAEIVSLEPLVSREDENAGKPYSFLRDFVVICGLTIILFFLLLVRLYPKLSADYFTLSRMLTAREADDGQTSARLTSSSNIQFYILCSLVIGLYLLIILYNLPVDYALPIRFHASGFWMIWVQWLKLSGFVFVALIAKLFIIFSLTRLFGFRGMARFHFFNWIRLLLVVFGAGTIVLFMYFISRGDSPDTFVMFLSLVIVALIVWIIVAYFKLSARSGHSMFHLFSYLCATEIIPLLITVKVLFQ
ncbi:MAG: DUF4271 domain-containing protein [Chryseosolibacter sp.]